MTLHISRQYHYDGPCPQPAEVTTLGDLANGEKRWVCGCGFCPEPDLTPDQLQRRVDQAAWQRAASSE